MRPERICELQKLVAQSYPEYYILCRWFYPDTYHHQLEAFPNSPEHYHIIAKATNKFYELVAINDEKT